MAFKAQIDMIDTIYTVYILFFISVNNLNNHALNLLIYTEKPNFTESLFFTFRKRLE